jgi:hypothetical protein
MWRTVQPPRPDRIEHEPRIRAMLAKRTRAAPVGCRRRCSKLRSVLTGMPIAVSCVYDCLDFRTLPWSSKAGARNKISGLAAVGRSLDLTRRETILARSLDRRPGCREVE